MQIINSVQKSILESFGDLADSDQFYLTGGTALAYFYLHHRKSNDLDFFTSEEKIVTSFSLKLEDILRARKLTVERTRGIHSFIELAVKDRHESTIVQLAQDAAFRFEVPRVFPEYPKLKVDGLLDIASNKLLALFGRAMLRDFVDVYYLIKTGKFGQNDLIEKAKKKDPGFDLYWLGVAFERIKTFDANSPEIHLLAEPLKLSDLASFFETWKRQIEQNLKK